jgi:hypothetical protein
MLAPEYLGDIISVSEVGPTSVCQDRSGVTARSRIMRRQMDQDTEFFVDRYRTA